MKDPESTGRRADRAHAEELDAATAARETSETM